MNSESLKSKKVNDEELDKDTPLSDEEVSRLIQASRETSFKRKEIKKEMAESFKKVSLHDIAKKYSKNVFPVIDDEIEKKEPLKKDNMDVEEQVSNSENEKEEDKEEKGDTQNNVELDEKKNEENLTEEPEEIKVFQKDLCPLDPAMCL